MPEPTGPTTPAGEAPADVERIRTILFGPQMRDYEQRFLTLQRDLERLQGELAHLSDQLAAQEADQNKKLQTLRSELQRADNEIRDELRQTAQKLTDDKVDRMTLGDLFIELGAHLKGGGSLPRLLKGIE
jgi:DNA anti-recombination protein RmuC